METPSSTKRVTRSQTIAALSNNNSNIPLSRKIEDLEKSVSKSRSANNNNHQQDRSALIDITNDSPIVGLSVGSLETPSPAMSKQRSNKIKIKSTPGSGEALLRGQVKTLLQKVEEEEEHSKISLENRPFLHLQGFFNSSVGLLVPTPANTPQILNLPGDNNINNNNGSVSVTPLPVIQGQLKIFQVVSEIYDGKKQENIESQKSLTRSLLLDFSEKSEIYDSSSPECSSVLTTHDGVGVIGNECKTDDGRASNWSIQVSASTHDEDEDEDDEEHEIEEDYYDYYEEGDDGDLIDELCEGIGKIKMEENISMAAAKFEGKHTRFVYNSDDDIAEDAVIVKGGVSSSVLHLKGLPTPKGKHLRFPMEEEQHEEYDRTKCGVLFDVVSKGVINKRN